jgi:transposase
MLADLANLSQDPDQLRLKLTEMAALLEQKEEAINTLCHERDHLKTAYEKAEAERSHLKVAYEEAEAERRRLDAVLQQLLHRQSGPRSERLDPEQFQLALENVEQDFAAAAAAGEAAGNTEDVLRRRRAPARRNLGHLPEHLPHEEIRLEPADTACPCCGGAMHEIAVEMSKRLHITPMKLRVRVILRPKYGCRTCAEAMVQAPAPDTIIPGGLPTEALLAYIAVAKYQDGQPLYRQCQIFARDGVTLDRQTPADWLGRTAWWLRPLWERLLADVLASPKLFADDTYLPVLDQRAASAKGRKAARTGYLWGLARDDAPWQGERPPAVAYVYTEDRVYARAVEVLAGYSGVLQVDGWGGFKRLIGKEEATTANVGAVTLAYCWAHGRRDFLDLHQSSGSPIAGEVLRRIADLYRIEDTIRGQPAEVRQAVRQEQSRPVVAALKVYLDEQLGRVSGKMPVAKAMRYLLKHWDGLCVFLEDGRIELDSNSIERRHRVVATVRRNSLFAGSDAGARSWAIFTSLIQTCRLNDIDPVTYLTDVLESMASGAVKANDLDRLLPWAWKLERAAQTA